MIEGLTETAKRSSCASSSASTGGMALMSMTPMISSALSAAKRTSALGMLRTMMRCARAFSP